jgi:uncharacterized RDD family membrane protein YckC
METEPLEKLVCYVHTDREGTTTCAACGHRLCTLCTYRLNDVAFCDACAPAQASSLGYEESYERVPLIDMASARPASVIARVRAASVDIALWCVVALGFALFLRWRVGEWNWGAWWISYSAGMLSFSIAYTAVLTAMSGQTIGHEKAHIIVLDIEGKVLNLQTALLRAAGSIISIIPLGLGYLWAIWDPKHQTWHDKWTKTMAYEYSE